MPAEGLEWLDRGDLLTFEEITRTARLLVERYGVESIRLTGGEPTIRADLAGLVQMLSCLLYTSPSPRDQRGSRMPSSA